MLKLHRLVQSLWTQSVHSIKTNYSPNIMKTCCYCTSGSSFSKQNKVTKTEKVARRTDEFVAPSPYKNPGPRRYGYDVKYMTQGCLPRDEKPVKSLPKYHAVDRWDKKSALFGQNDYIDILGDGDIHPSDLLTGPPWLLGFKGNERERLLRKMEWQGARTKILYPAEFNRMQKRIRYLTKIYNTRRHTRKRD